MTGAARRSSRSQDLLAHVGHVEMGDRADSANSAVAASGSSVWTWTFSVVWSPTTSTESPSRSSAATNRRCSSPVPVTAKLVQ